MKNRILPFFFATLLLSFTACQKESITADIPSQEQSPEEYLNSLGQSVFFQYDYQNEATGEYHGWFVDNTGAVKTYELQSAAEASTLSDASTWTPDQLRRLYNWAKETRHRMTPRELAQMVRRIRAASQGRLSDRVPDNGRTERATFRSFLLTQRQVNHADNQGGCNGNSNYNTDQTTTTVNEVKVITLKTSGAFAQENQSEDARAITRWLEGIAASAGL